MQEAPIRGDAIEHPSFRIGPCPACDRVVLTARDLEGSDLVDLCLHCDHRLQPDDLEWAGPRDIIELGYVIDGYEEEECDSHGGCRDGSCGVQQPD